MNGGLALAIRIALVPLWLAGMVAYVAVQLLMLLIAVPMIAVTSATRAAPRRPGATAPAEPVPAGVIQSI